MIFVIKMSLGMSSTHSFEELDLLTFDGIIIPFKLKITPFAGKPNSVNQLLHYNRMVILKFTSSSNY